MDLVSIFPTESTYINSKYSDVNYFNSSYLRIDNFENSKSNTLLNFPLKIYNKNINMKYYLYLPLKSIECCSEGDFINLDIICNYVNFEQVTYEYLYNMELYPYSYVCISKEEIQQGYILTDISPLINKYMQKGKVILNLMLSSPSENFSIKFNKECFNRMPRLIIDSGNYGLSNNDNNTCNTTCGKTVAMQLIRNNLREENVVIDDGIINFDEIVEKTPTGIQYRFESGIIDIYEKGYYLFQWDINIEGSTAIEVLSVDLKNNTKNLIILCPVPTSIQGQITGMALVHVTQNHEAFSLINTSSGDLLLSDTSPCASIIITKI